MGVKVSMCCMPETAQEHGRPPITLLTAGVHHLERRLDIDPRPHGLGGNDGDVLWSDDSKERREQCLPEAISMFSTCLRGGYTRRYSPQGNLQNVPSLPW